MTDIVVFDNEPTAILVCDQSTVIVTGEQSSDIIVVNEGIPGPAASTQEWLDALDQYTSNLAAISDGKQIGDWYLAAEGHEAVYPGLPIKILFNA